MKQEDIDQKEKCPKNRAVCPVNFDTSFCDTCVKFGIGEKDNIETVKIIAEASKPALTITVFKDGTIWAAHWSDFVNLQESPCGFGETPEYAVRNLIVETGIKYV